MLKDMQRALLFTENALLKQELAELKAEASKTYLNTTEMRQRFGVTPMTLTRWVRTGILPEPIYRHNQRAWPVESVDEAERRMQSDKATRRPKAKLKVVG